MIAVVGLGFVGLTTALGFSHKGFTVYGCDTDTDKTRALRNGNIPFHEPRLAEVLNRSLNHSFFVCDELKQAVENSRIIFYCVGTPTGENGCSNLSHVFTAIEETLKHVKKGSHKVLVVKSTVPPSTTDEQLRPFIERLGFTVGKDVGLANNPEFLREGHAWEDFVNPDRIVIGCDEAADGKTLTALREVYKAFAAPIFAVSLNTGEFIKYLSNTLLATMISYSNEMSMIADAIGNIDVKNAFEILHLDKRWVGSPANMSTYVYPGCGFGGYCLPKDTLALCSQSAQKGFTPLLLENVLLVNQKIKEFVAVRIEQCVRKDEWLGILGLSFKAQSDDVRETPAKDIIDILLEKGYTKIIAYDPLATGNFAKAYHLPISYAKSLESILDKADHFLILTSWDEFKDKNAFKNKNVIDFRYIL